MRATRMRALAAVMLIAGLAGFRPAADPAAVLVQLAGSVQVQKAGQAAGAAKLGVSLEAGDRVIVPAGAKAVLLYRTGRMETVTQSLTVAEPQSQQPGTLYQQTVNTIAQVATTDARRQPNRQGMIRPIAGEPVPILPRNGVRVLDVRPTFVWFAVPDARDYMVQVRRLDIEGARPIRYPAGRDTLWSYPHDAPPLVPGGSYEWTVAAMPGGRPAGTQQFTVADVEAFSRVAALHAALGSAGIDVTTDGAFVAALAYRDAGMAYEAARLLDGLEKSGSASGRAYHLLRADVLDRLGDLEGAARAFAAADAEPEA